MSKILFTGASSFTGYWFVKELASRGHEVWAICQLPKSAYKEGRGIRVEAVEKWAAVQFQCPFGSPAFFDLIQKESFDLFCHHAADVVDYKSPEFNPVKALANNTGPLKQILETLKKRGCYQVILTGSVFEPGEGAGSHGLRAVSPYGLSKGLTSEMFKYYTEVLGMRLGKFVIPNPFGPYEEFRFTSFLAKQWLEGNSAHVTMPSYVRDNIPVSLLARAYTAFVERENSSNLYEKHNPSGYPESQGAFVARFANAMRTRLGVPCEYILKTQQDFSEPMVRINTDTLNKEQLGWNEELAWDELAHFYQQQFSYA